jgi:DNA-binding NtrC family response regulator
MNARGVVLLVGDDRSNLELLSQQLDREGYATLTAVSLEELDQAIRGKAKVVFSLIDIAGFGEDIWGRCEALVRIGTPFIVIAPRRSPALQRQSMKYGASGLLTRPLEFKDLMESVHAMLGD